MEFKWDIHVPQISRMNTDFLTWAVRFTQIFWTCAVWGVNPIYL